MLATVNLFAGLAWDPGIRGILIVAVGVAVLCGSVYLLLATNTGARLGMLLALTGLFGWLVILTFIWWLMPPAIGPRGTNPSWQPVEIYVNGPETPVTEAAQNLPQPQDLPQADRILAENPDLSAEYPNGFVISDLAANNPELLEQYLDEEALNGWRVIPSSSAGESQAAADVALVDSGFFSAATEYKKLDTFSYGGKQTRAEACPDDGALCRAWYRVRKSFQITHPPHYAIVQVQRVVTPTAVPGEAPPLPEVDPSAPVVSVVMVRDLGTVRLIPFLYFVISLALFIVFAWVLHSRDKTLQKNMRAAEAALKGA
jgi:hypothetical protein